MTRPDATLDATIGEALTQSARTHSLLLAARLLMPHEQEHIVRAALDAANRTAELLSRIEAYWD